ncbi:unnamed protein product [Mycena citricolor]|uniref:ribonuclease H n=1 Tax=Mycena citricolor TaxID=2018698 RepID=A0AAD2Q6N9_9AGAR|nr:unnamed protein product [Mycena citricolor]
MLDTLDPKWDPRQPQPEDYEGRMNPQTLDTQQGEGISIEIDQRLTTKGTVGDTFRIFTEDITNNSASAPNREHWGNPDDIDEIVVYTDGSATGNGSATAEAGSGIWFGVDNIRNRSIKVPKELRPSNQVAELLAVKEAVEICPPAAPLHIKTDSMYTINALTKSMQKAEDTGFHLMDNGDVVRLTITKVRNRRARTRLTWVKGHAGIEGNEEADKLADIGRTKQDPDIIDSQVDPALRLPGAKLKAMTQSIAYKIIRKKKMMAERYEDALERRATRKNIERAVEATRDNETGHTATEGKIWKSTRHTDFSRSVRYFLWMLIHDGYKVGNHWTKIPGHEEKASCAHCGDHITENMEHILFECEAQGQKTVWELANELWMMKTSTPLNVSIADLMACGTVSKGNEGTSRLFRILVSESAHLIWRIRCERVIQEKDEATIPEIRNRWINKMNTRLLLDCKLSNEAKYGTKHIKASLVRKTCTSVTTAITRFSPRGVPTGYPQTSC